MKILLLISFSISAILILVGLYRIQKYRKLSSWPEAQAEILSIQEKFKSVRQQYYSLKYLYPEITYTYHINGTKHTSSSVAPHIRNIWLCETDNWGKPLDSKSKFWQGWQAGTSIGVFVNPTNSAESYVIIEQSKTHRSHNYAIVAGGIILLLVSAALAIHT